ncbi:hypothetical protein [Massilia agri]|uniref:Uncharacterized protein n=1 Tax=Massilia agri TaxID=1886785 RepID=A0ABT2AL01_9BURK|nr:hypothetical protein [Massilia agri]MCS0596931.1 hypothetical protein [Massilia agri]
MAIKKQTGRASRSATTIRAILLVRFIDTIRARSWLIRSELNFDMAIRCWLEKKKYGAGLVCGIGALMKNSLVFNAWG